MPSRKRSLRDEDPMPKKRKVTAEEVPQDDVSLLPGFELEGEAEVGIVEKISLTNFMCHKKLEVSPGANVNFIIGRNGSGKSAILTGLIVGLGGKANMTSRGNSLKGFIKEGCQYCSVVITLRNKGPDAYNPKAYGEAITVERRITSDGSGSYKIKSADDKVISTKRDELVTILEQFNIQINNPVSILTQDTARSFLNTSDPKDKYTFFLKATQLENLSTNYQKTMEEKMLHEGIIKKKKQALTDLHQEVKIHKEKYKDMQQLEDMKEKIKSLQKEWAWSTVQEKKDEVDKREDNKNRCTQKIPNYEKHVNDTLKKEEEIQKLYSEKSDELTSYTEDIKALLNEKNELQNAHKQKKQDQKNASNKCKMTERDIRRAKDDIKLISNRIEEIRGSMQQDLEAERQEREQDIERKKAELREYESNLSKDDHSKQGLENEIKKHRDQKYAMSKDIQDVKRIVENKQKNLLELENNKRNKLYLFGHSTEAILKAIAAAHREGKFHQKPVGPLGSLIKLKDSKWAIAVEECIKKAVMMSYACHDGHDMKILKEIFKRISPRKQPQIIVSSFQDHFYDVSRNRPHSHHPVVLDILDIENPIVFNSLVDQCGVESVLLIEDPKEAQRVMWDEKPQKAFKAFSIRGHQILGGRSSKYYPCNKERAEFLEGDVAGVMRQVEGELLQARRDLKRLSEETQAIDAGIRQRNSELDRSRKACYSHQDKINNVTEEIRELESFEEEQLPDVGTLITDLKDCEEKRNTLEQNLIEDKVVLEERSEEVTVHQEELRKCNGKCEEASERLETLKSKNDQLAEELTKVKGNKKHYADKFEELMIAVKRATDAYEEITADYEKTRSQALEFCEEVATRRTTQSLESEIQKTEKRIQREEARRGNSDEVREKYHNILKKYEKIKGDIKNNEKLIKFLDCAIRRRSRSFAKFQRLLTLRARYFFEMLLSQRGYVGKMKINHEEETLFVQVNVENAEGASTKDSKALSGGERSFSTICFIMALWDAMEAPFRCLDEFDVFMDMVNRRISMGMLMKIAKEQKHRQFILLTPQDMSSVAGSERVRLFRLNDPERGQQTLTFPNA